MKVIIFGILKCICCLFYLHQSRHCESIAYLSSNYFTASAKRAQELSQDGALFAWRTIDGQETSAYYPAGTAQLHINADIVYAFQLYERVTGDVRFIEEVGSEVVFETAKFWLSYGDFIEKDGKPSFCINGVTGPDEYSALVNNNFYTNKMAQNNLYYAIELAKRYEKHMELIDQWQQAADLMYFGYDASRGLTKQDDEFLEQSVWPLKRHQLLTILYCCIIIR